MPQSRYGKVALKDCLELANGIIFCGEHTPSLVHSTSTDSITLGAEMAAAG